MRRRYYIRSELYQSLGRMYDSQSSSGCSLALNHRSNYCHVGLFFSIHDAARVSLFMTQRALERKRVFMSALWGRIVATKVIRRSYSRLDGSRRGGAVPDCALGYDRPRKALLRV